MFDPAPEARDPAFLKPFRRAIETWMFDRHRDCPFAPAAGPLRRGIETWMFD
jgi:hypothetical protein